MNVVITVPYWSINGVNIFFTRLSRGLAARGVKPVFLLTWSTEFRNAPYPEDLQFEILLDKKEWLFKKRRQMLADYLKKKAPCIYMPGYDYPTSCISGRLSKGVGIVGVVNSDDPNEYDHVRRLSRYWNAVVAVSRHTAEKTSAIVPERLRPVPVIHYGVPLSEKIPPQDVSPGRPLKIVYTGRFEQAQKRVLDLVKIAEALEARGVPAEWTLIGTGFGDKDEKRLIELSRPLVQKGHFRFAGALSNEQVQQRLEEQDVFVLPSQFEGMSISLLEAMAAGCVPVVSSTESGAPELIRDGFNGHLVPVGDIDGFADRLTRLYKNPDGRRDMALRARRTIREGDYSIEQMAERYYALFCRILEEVGRPPFKSRRGRVIVPSHLKIGWKDRFRYFVLRNVYRIRKRIAPPAKKVLAAFRKK